MKFITILWLLLLAALSHTYAQSCDNICLDFDGNANFITLSPAPVSGNADFSVEMWFNSDATSTSTSCSGNFKRLFSFGGSGFRFEIGECGGFLNLFVQGAFPTTQLFTQDIRTGGLGPQNWHHLAVTRQGNTVNAYLNSSTVFSINTPIAYNISTFRIGAWTGGSSPDQYWEGQIDELRLWDYPLTQTEVDDRMHCALAGNETGLVTYWQFDEGDPGQNNTALTSVIDGTSLGNDGTFSSNFLLNGNGSNYLNSTAGMVYPNYQNMGFDILEYPYRTAPLSEICNGEPAHFCQDKAGITPPVNPNVTVFWEFSEDGGLTWLPETNPNFIDYCFAVPSGNLNTLCSTPEGFVNRLYRARNQVFDPTLNETCDYFSEEKNLKICCPISPVSINLQPNTALCEGQTVTVTVNLVSPDPFIQIPGSMTNIDWFYDDGTGPVNIGFNNQTSFSYTLTAPAIPTPGSPLSLCFSAEIQHCNKNGGAQACLVADPEPICGSIINCPSPNTLTLIATSPHDIYDICPGNDAALQIDPADPFFDCIPEWEYSFDCVTWSSVGYSNSKQNTNILPTVQPPVPWPAGAASIFYRIKCNPLSSPSGCDPCFSDKVEVQLRPDPVVPIISGSMLECKENLPAVLTVSNADPAATYEWFCNGISVGNGSTFSATQDACYEVVASNGCVSVASALHCLEVCEILAVISCPLTPNECAKSGDPITLSACGSTLSCDNGGVPLQFSWIIDGVPQATTSCTITHTPPLAGSTYEVIVTDPVNGCVGGAMRTVVPCDF